MSRRCELSGVGVQFGNNVSHSQRKTRRRFNPNIRNVRYFSDCTNQAYEFDITAKMMRTIEKLGGFDSFIVNWSSDNMSIKAQRIRKLIMKKKIDEVVA